MTLYKNFKKTLLSIREANKSVYESLTPQETVEETQKKIYQFFLLTIALFYLFFLLQPKETLESFYLLFLFLTLSLSWSISIALTYDESGKSHKTIFNTTLSELIFYKRKIFSFIDLKSGKTFFVDWESNKQLVISSRRNETESSITQRSMRAPIFDSEIDFESFLHSRAQNHPLSIIRKKAERDLEREFGTKVEL